MFFRENCRVRADRLVSLVLLLRQRGRMTADELAEELEVSSRTIQRDIEALSAAGVPVYADRGRYGGFALLPGFRTELTGLTHDEALALLTAASARGPLTFGLNTALGTAMRKVVDALPDTQRGRVDTAARRLLVEPDHDLLGRTADVDDVDPDVLAAVRGAVLDGRRLSIVYATVGREAAERIIDPVGLVTVGGRTYLLALVDGHDRTYRLSRMSGAAVLDEPAQRPDDVDLDALWAERAARFLRDRSLLVTVEVARGFGDELVRSARAGRVLEAAESADRLRLELSFDDLEHALWAVWRAGLDAVVLEPASLRDALADRAAEALARYRRGRAGD